VLSDGQLISEEEIEFFKDKPNYADSRAIVKILGRPITILDVMNTLAKKYEDWEYALSISGELLKMIRNNENGFAEFEGTGIHFELGKPLSEQSEETIINLLKIFEV
jgi:hypothetical protein